MSRRGSSSQPIARVTSRSTYNFSLKGLLINHNSFDNYKHVLRYARVGDILAVDRFDNVQYIFVGYVSDSDYGTDLVCFYVQLFERGTKLAIIKKEMLKTILADNDHNQGLDLTDSIPSSAYLSPVKIDNQGEHARKFKLRPRNENMLNYVIKTLDVMSANCQKVIYGSIKSNSEQYVTSWRYGLKWCSMLWPMNVPKKVSELPGFFPREWDSLSSDLLLSKLKTVLGEQFEFSSVDPDQVTELQRKQDELMARERELELKTREVAAKELDLDAKQRALDIIQTSIERSAEVMSINSDSSCDDILVIQESDYEDEDDGQDREGVDPDWTSVMAPSIYNSDI